MIVEICAFLIGGTYFVNHQKRPMAFLDDANKRYLHFSLDDVHECLERLSDTRKESIFEDSTLAILKKWHDKYGIVVTLYCQGDFSINSKYARELIKNSSWLKFGYHGNHYFKLGIGKFNKQIIDSVGSDVIIDKCLRLDYYRADYITCMILRQYGCIGFLSCDDWSYNSKEREYNYYLSDQQSLRLDKSSRLIDTINHIAFIKTDFRLEHIKQRWGNTKKCLKYYQKHPTQSRELIIFSHEWIFKEYVSEADSIFSWSVHNNYLFDFPMNNIQLN